MQINEMEQLAFIIAKELDVNKSDVDLIKSIRENKNAYCSALKQIPVKKNNTQIMNSPF